MMEPDPALVKRDRQHLDEAPGARGGGKKHSADASHFNGHSWAEAVRPGLTGGKGGTSTLDRLSGNTPESIASKLAAQTVPSSKHGTCRRCGAWRGVLGLEPTPEMFVEHIVQIAREWRRVLRDDGTLWMNLGDSYNANQGSGFNAHSRTRPHLVGDEVGQKRIDEASRSTVMKRPPGLKPKDLVGIPWMCAFGLRADGWYLRQDICWSKNNPMPESVRDRCTKAHEYVFLLTKSQRYFIDMHAIREPVTSTGGASFGKQDHDATGTGAQSRKLADARERNHPLGRNSRSVWTISTESFPEAHFATFPSRLAAKCIRAGTSEKGCCPACGAAWVRVVGREKTGRKTKMPDGMATHAGDHGSIHIAGREKGKPNDETVPVTTDWRPSCDCPAHEPVPCVVLDPFSGAGTTAIVASVLGRRGIGVELKADYIDIAVRRAETGRERIVNRVIGRPAKTKTKNRKTSTHDSAMDLFGEVTDAA